MNSHFSAMKNRQKISEAKKNLRRNKVSKKKDKLLNSQNNNQEKYTNTTEISEKELNQIKKNIRKKFKRKNKKQLIIFLLIIIFVSILFIFLSNNIKIDFFKNQE